MIIDLPWAPSVNRYWRHPSTGKLAGRHLISEEGRKYRKAVAVAVRAQFGIYQPIRRRLSVQITAFPPDHRRRRMNDMAKAVLDSIIHAGVILGDLQIDRLVIERLAVIRGGRIVVMIDVIRWPA